MWYKMQKEELALEKPERQWLETRLCLCSLCLDKADDGARLYLTDCELGKWFLEAQDSDAQKNCTNL